MDSGKTIDFLRRKNMGIDLKIPTINQIITLAIALVIVTFIVKMLPVSVQNLFRVG